MHHRQSSDFMGVSEKHCEKLVELGLAIRRNDADGMSYELDGTGLDVLNRMDSELENAFELPLDWAGYGG